MSYVAGSTLGRLREILGDTADDELFTNDQLNDYLTQCNNVLGYAAARALRRIVNNPELLRKKYESFGRMDAATIASFQRNLLDQVKALEESELSVQAAVDVSPEADNDDVFISTDEDGQHKTSTLDSYLLHKEGLT